jgi:tRNA U34 5-carboxymethylaminomethyl modifying GTPase MnmE/TrmE
MIKNKVEKKTTVPQNIISEDDVKISDSARKLVETARNKVSDFHTMHFSSINGEIREIPAEYKCENLFKYIFISVCIGILHFIEISDFL